MQLGGVKKRYQKGVDNVGGNGGQWLQLTI